MPEPARPLPDGFDTWHNDVPAWIRAHPAVTDPPRGRGVKASTLRRFLQVMADAGDLDDAGNIVRIFGNAKLCPKIGIRRRAFWTYVDYAHRRGLLVVLAVGGVLGAGQDAAHKRNIANTYGMPAQEGTLDHLAVDRREQTMRPMGRPSAAGYPALAPSVDRPGEQPGLFAGPETRGRDPAPGHYPRVPRTLPPCSECTHNHALPSPLKHHGRRTRRRRRGPKASPGKALCPHVELADLRVTARLLSLYDACRLRGLLDGVPNPRLSFVALAEHALAMTGADAPRKCAVFASNVTERRYHHVTDRAEQAAQRRLVEHDAPAAAREPDAAPPRPEPRSADALIAANLRKLCRRDAEQARRLALHKLGWDEQRFVRAWAEIGGAA